MRWKVEHVHFIGIGGIGMSGIAEVLLNLGYRVSGSDLKESEFTTRLSAQGAEIYYRHHPDQVKGADVVVVSSAVREDNPEVQAAHTRGLPVIPRAEMLAELMRMKNGIAIAGAHGKTTVTSMVAIVLQAAGWDPTAVIGGRLNTFGSNARLGTGEWIVAEADESDGTFLKLRPMLAVVTNIDREHMDHYREFSHLENAFVEFINSVPFYGLSVVCADCPVIKKILPRVSRPHLTYGEGEDAEFRAVQIGSESGGCHFTALKGREELGRVKLGMPGRHNALNALASIVVGLELEIGFTTIARALEGFRGIHRRFEIKAVAKEAVIVDDYAHHPTEIQATIRAAREWMAPAYFSKAKPERVICVFQPHRYSRTQDLKEEFIHAFDEADILILTEIYSAGEEPRHGITGEWLYDAIKKGTRNERLRIEFISNREDIPARLAGLIEKGDLILTMGAGNIWQVGDALLEILGGEGN